MSQRTEDKLSCDLFCIDNLVQNSGTAEELHFLTPARLTSGSTGGNEEDSVSSSCTVQRLSVTRVKSPPHPFKEQTNHHILLCAGSSLKLPSHKAFPIPFSFHGCVWWGPISHFQKQDLCKIAASKRPCPNNRTIACLDKGSGE